jgi:threonine dehydrogenase-like Zn-dependent dehydrogenase
MNSPAVVNFAPAKGSVEIREIARPVIGEEDVLLEVANVGVCGSDLHQWTADHSWPVNYPVVLGHEFAGRIVELGKKVEGWKEGDRVVVLGPGTIGILCAAMAKQCGAEVAIVGLPQDAHRLAIAKQYGCEVIIGDAKPWAQQRDGLGCDGVIDAAGASATLKIALDIVRPAGWVSKVGWGPQPLGFNLDPLVQKNITLQGSFSHNWPIWERVIALMASGQFDVRPIIGGVWPITDWHTAFEKMHKGEVVKSVLKPV